MITINNEACTGCGRCRDDCFPNVIDITDNKAVAARNEACIKCGHCVAVCPNGAVSVDGYDMSEVTRVSDDLPTPDQLLRLIKQRRSIRRFKPKPIADEQLDYILQAGRFTPTARNLQNTSYVVIRNREMIQALRGMALERLAVHGHDLLKIEDMALRGKKLIAMRDEFVSDPGCPDKLFFSAPMLILIISDKEGARDAAAASEAMELMAASLGLGVLFSGYTVIAATKNKEIKKLLKIDENKEVIRCLVVGYPDVKYINTVPRKALDITEL